MFQKYGFGRAHHQVLHCVGRNPELKVAELLKLLKAFKKAENTATEGFWKILAALIADENRNEIPDR